MAEGTTLGKAWVQIVPSAKGIAGSIRNLLNEEAAPAGKSAGNTIGSSMVGAIKGVIAAAGIGAAVKSSITAGMNFDSEMAHVSAISGATGEAFDTLRAKALELGSSTKFSATESAQAFGYMAMAGWDVEQMMDGVDGILSLAAADGLDLASTSDIVTDALTGFNLSAADAGHFADVLATASSSANTNVSMMGETFKYAASVVGSLYGEEGRAVKGMEDSALAIGLMANAGIKSTQAGTAFRSILTRISTDAGASAESLGALGILTERLGVEFYDESGKARDFSEVLNECRSAWSGLSTEEQTSYAKKIAGQEAMSGWLAMMNASEESVNGLAEAIANADGAAERMSGIMQETLEGAVTSFGSAVEGLQIAVYDKFSGGLTRIVDLARDAVSAITTTISTGDLTPLVEFGSNLFQKLSAGITEKIPSLMESAKEIIAGLGTFLREKLPDMIPAAVEIIAQLAAFLTSPSTLVGIVNAAGDIIIGIIEGLVKTLPKLIEYAPQITANLITAILGSIPKIIEVGASLIGGLLSGIIQGAVGLLAYIPLLIADLIKSFKNLLGIHSPSTVFADIGKNLIAGFLQGIQSMWNTVTTFFSGRIESIKTTFRGLETGMRTIGSNVVNGLKNGISAAWEGMGGIGKWFADKVGGLARTAKQVLGVASPSKVFSEIGGYMAEGLGEGWQDTFSSVRRTIADGLDFSSVSIPANAPAIQDLFTDESFTGSYPAWKKALFSTMPQTEKRSYSFAERESRTNSQTDYPIPTIVVNCILDGQKVGAAVASYQRNQRRAYGF